MLIDDILLSFMDISVETLYILDGSNLYRKPISDYRRWRRKTEYSRQTAHELKRRELLGSDQDGYFLTPKAIKHLNKIAVEKITIPKPKAWDKKWRVVFFDIPEKKKNARDVFRDRLKELGFEQIQKSVFAYPHDCLNEITQIIKIYEIEKYVTYIETKKVITGKDLIKIFAEKELI